MTEIIERVADVLQSATALDRPEAITLARRTISAMREPDRVVVKAMCRSLYPECRPTADRVGASEKHRIRWRAAIDRIVRDQEATA